MSWKLRWAGWNKGLKKNKYGFYGVVKWIDNKKKVNEELQKTSDVNARITGKTKLIVMPKSIVKEKLIEWAETEQMQMFWNDTEPARESGDPDELNPFLFDKWKYWKKMEGYK